MSINTHTVRLNVKCMSFCVEITFSVHISAYMFPVMGERGNQIQSA